MLSLERLMDEAKLRSLPADKKRAIVREYAQVIMLRHIYQDKKAIEKLFFLGGTALRLAYDLPRFSEDLDFDGENLSKSEFSEMLEIAKNGLLKEGFSCEIALSERGSLIVGKFKLTDILQKYRIAVMHDEKLMIKVEANRPSWHLEREPLIMSGYGYSFSVLLINKSTILGEKLHALLNRRRGRDIYDILFMLGKRFPFDESFLRELGIKSDGKKVLIEHIDSLSESELETLAAQVRPFLFREEEAELVTNAKKVLRSLLDKY
ncbi:MAG: nucleotidyl transferase AbiEii/AbiGii toxin family protein [Candidatus Omnitrophica bacterium]|nr:nucleotidyl transferase AbiEii/AbiGii toxin family protein [Candidatus Omnitrophota bacterium]